VESQGYPFRTQAIAVGDVDEAAGLELIVADETRVAVLSRASGQWVVTAFYSTNVGLIDAVAVIDHRVAFVNDGVLKLMTVTPMETVTVATFPRPGLCIVRAADIDRDGRQDLIVARSSIGSDAFTGPEYFDGRIFVLYARADGTFASPEEVFDARTSSCCDGAIYDILAADFTGDGNPDIVAATLEKRLLLLTGNGKGAFVQSTIASRVAQIAARDVDGDGITDLAVSDRYAYLYYPRPGLSLYRGTTHGLSHHGTWLTSSELFLTPVIAQLRSGTAPALLISRNLTEATVIEFDCRTRRRSAPH
jgi:hypothetical protein